MIMLPPKRATSFLLIFYFPEAKMHFCTEKLRLCKNVMYSAACTSVLYFATQNT